MVSEGIRLMALIIVTIMSAVLAGMLFFVELFANSTINVGLGIATIFIWTASIVYKGLAKIDPNDESDEEDS